MNIIVSFILGFITSSIISLQILSISEKKKHKLKFNNEQEAGEYIYKHYGDMLANSAKDYYNDFYDTHTRTKEEWINEISGHLYNVLLHKFNESNIEFTEKELNYLTDDILNYIFSKIIIDNCKGIDNENEDIIINKKTNNTMPKSNSNSVDISSVLNDFYKE